MRPKRYFTRDRLADTGVKSQSKITKFALSNRQIRALPFNNRRPLLRWPGQYIRRLRLAAKAFVQNSDPRIIGRKNNHFPGVTNHAQLTKSRRNSAFGQCLKPHRQPTIVLNDNVHAHCGLVPRI